MTVQLLPDAEAFLSDWLRGQSEIADEIADRLYTVLPKDKVWPLARLVRIGGAPLQTAEGDVWGDSPSFQVDVWAARKADAWRVARTLQAVLPRARGDHGPLKVSGVMLGPVQYAPDPEFTPAQPRVIFTLDLIIHPTPEGAPQ